MTISICPIILGCVFLCIVFVLFGYSQLYDSAVLKVFINPEFKTKLLSIRQNTLSSPNIIIPENFINETVNDFIKVHPFLFVRNLILDRRKDENVIKLVGLIGRLKALDEFAFNVTIMEMPSISFDCHLYWNDHNETKPGQLQVLTHDSTWVFGTCQLFCSYPPDSPPSYIKINNHYYPLVDFFKFEAPPKKHYIAMCARPWYGYPNSDGVYDNVYQLAEWIEFYRILGVDFFSFYTGPIISSNVRQLFNHYVKIGVVEFVNWSLPVHEYSYVHDYAQTTLLQDCWMRHAGRSQFVINMDVDEYAIPRGVKTYKELFNKNPSSYYLFRSSFHYLEDAVEDMKNKYDIPLITQYTPWRQQEILPWDSRTKYVVSTDDVSIMRVHDVIAKSGEPRMFEPHELLIHHYRWARGVVGNNGIGQWFIDQLKEFNVTRDENAFSYGEELATNIKRLFTTVFNTYVLPVSKPKTFIRPFPIKTRLYPPDLVELLKYPSN